MRDAAGRRAIIETAFETPSMSFELPDSVTAFAHRLPYGPSIDQSGF
jgi:hypothetical protein